LLVAVAVVSVALLLHVYLLVLALVVGEEWIVYKKAELSFAVRLKTRAHVEGDAEVSGVCTRPPVSRIVIELILSLYTIVEFVQILQVELTIGLVCQPTLLTLYVLNI